MEPGHQRALPKPGRTRPPQESRAGRLHAMSPRHSQCNRANENPMAMRVKDGIEPIKSPTDMDRGGSRPKPPKAVAQRASLEATRPMSDHRKSKRRLTDKTVAFWHCSDGRGRAAEQAVPSGRSDPG